MIKHELVDLYKQRIDYLLNKINIKNDISNVEACFMGSINVIESLYGNNSIQAKMFLERKNKFDIRIPLQVIQFANSIHGTLKNIKDELDKGLIRNITRETAGEVIGDMTTLAKSELKEGYTNVASVLASASLEDAMKRKAEEFGLDIEGKSLDEVINALKSKSFFKGAQSKIVPSFVKLRDYAMHAEWDKIQEPEVSSLIGFLESFLLEHFS